MSNDACISSYVRICIKCGIESKILHTVYLKTLFICEVNEPLNIVSSLLFMLKPSQKDANYFWWNILVKQHFYQICVCVFTPLLSLALVRFLSPTYFSISVVAVDVFVCFHFRSFADVQFIQIIGSIHPWLVQSQVALTATHSCFVHIRHIRSV